MKKVLLMVVVMLVGVKGWGQPFGYVINFENSLTLNHVIIDSANCTNNKWQIGKPSKTVFDSSYSYPRAIVTDTLYPVPAKDTSVFYLKHARLDWMKHFRFELDFWHKMDGDSTDFGRIEIMPDTEGVWVNVLEEDTTYDMVWILNNKPSLKGSTNGWDHVHVMMWDWAINDTSGTYPVKWNADTILVRFTYITDSGSTPHDGWMIDDIDVYDWFESVVEVPRQSIISIAPNPVEDVLHIKRKIGGAKDESIRVVNMMGEVVKEVVNFSGETVDVSHLPKGVYLLRYSCDKGEAFLNFEL